MLRPKDVLTRNKLRDAKIVNDWLAGETQEDIAEKLGLTRQSVYSILRKNRPAIKIDKEFNKVERIHYLNNALANSRPSEKDRLDILEALRKEIEGDKQQININHNVVQVYMPTELEDQAQIESTEPTESTEPSNGLEAQFPAPGTVSPSDQP